MAAAASPTADCDVFVVGAGLAGATAAIGFARARFRVVSCGPLERLGGGRTVALMGRSVEMLRGFGVWDAVAARASPLRSLRIVDDTGSLFAARPVEFHASEIGLEAFGWNIENAALADILAGPLAAEPGIVRVEPLVAEFDFSAARAGLGTSDGRRFAARLVIGADGRNSATRGAADIDVSSGRHGQTALTTLLAHARDHGEVSTEFHTRDGPFTLVPLPPGGAGFRSSLVWLMKDRDARRRAELGDAELAAEIETRARALLGAVRVVGGRGSFALIRQTASRLTAKRLALVGDAAHAFAPIGAQGLNLGLRDVDALLQAALAARAAGEDFGGAAALAGYAASRRSDIAARMFAVNALNVSLLADFAPIDALRGLGLAALSRVGPLRRMAMRAGMGPGPAR
jgi:2-octaprenyl-6-methoxyphenol hydroxylase